MSVLLEQRLTKEQIMAMYCNQIYLGQRSGVSINGFGEAARSYFDKDISQLSRAESALLAGIIRSPNYYSPFTQPDRSRDRRNLVLEKMAEAGEVSRAEAEAAKAAPLGLRGRAADQRLGRALLRRLPDAPARAAVRRPRRRAPLAAHLLDARPRPPARRLPGGD